MTRKVALPATRALPIDRQQERIRQVLERDPLLLLPTAELRVAVALAWQSAGYLSAMSSVVPMVLDISSWVEEYGLSPEGAAKVLGEMRSPSAAKRVTTGGQWRAELARRVEDQIRREESERECRERRDGAAAFAATVLSGVGAMPEPEGKR